MSSIEQGIDWSEPQPVSFSGFFRDISPCFSADGNKLYFSSDRPHPSDPTANNFHIWVSDRSNEEWSEPVPILFSFLSINGEMHPSLTADNILYFSANFPDLGGDGFYRSVLENGNNQAPEKLILRENQAGCIDVEPFISADERFLLFYSAGCMDNFASEGMTGDIYITKRNTDGTWDKPINMGYTINTAVDESTPTLSPDGEFLFFASIRDLRQTFPDIYWVRFIPEKIN